ncbi:hypothetical protein [Borrelia hispanica]|nr:hypothetical protein [Borrelia hispanica]
MNDYNNDVETDFFMIEFGEEFVIKIFEILEILTNSCCYFRLNLLI